ncbi:MAG: hypothetical protein IAE87_16700 [Rhodobacteraceae bacterium]|nr:hypothetical protein [Paracoccaceae bacterium]
MVAIEGGGEAQISGGDSVALTPGLRLPPGSRIVTGPGARAELALASGGSLHAGSETSVGLASGSGNESLNISGVAVIDRRGTPGEVTVDIASFEVLLADARVFIDSVQGGSVFVKDGTAEVVLPDTRLALLEGQGVDLPGRAEPTGGGLPPVTGTRPAPSPPLPGADAPLLPQVWGERRIEAAFASVGLIA